LRDEKNLNILTHVLSSTNFFKKMTPKLIHSAYLVGAATTTTTAMARQPRGAEL
jgi:hypothetical protein